MLRLLAAKYRELPGRYYILKALVEKNQGIWEKARLKAREAEDVEAFRACEVVLRGIPEWISDFVVEPLYVLARTNGSRERVVRIRNVHGEITDVLKWPSEQFSSPKAMRIWLSDNANCANWAAGERELNFLGMDIGQAVSDKGVTEITLRAHDWRSGIWFYSDGALKDGKPLYRDANGVYWHNGHGYLPGEKDQEGECFRMGPKPQLPGPNMHPLVEVKRDTVQALFKRLMADCFDAIGGYAGWLGIGAAVSFFASKELFERFAAIPGLWASGEPAQGKTSFVRWLMRIHGYCGKTGVPLPGSTQSALRGAMQQYGDMPLWLDEFQTRCEDWVIDIAKAAYDRGGNIKRTLGDMPREIRTGLIISGVATSLDAQLRSRYCHVQVASSNRINFDSDRYQQVETYTQQLWKLGRFILENRAEFARLLVQQVEYWSKDPKLVNCDDRSRIVHGFAYAGVVALAALLETHGPVAFTQFKEFVRGHIAGAQEDVRDQLMVSQFFQDLLSAEKMDMFGETPSDLRRYFKAVEKEHPDAAVSLKQAALGQATSFCRWKGKLLYIAAKDVVEVTQAYRRRLGDVEHASRKDLLEQMRGRPYFMEAQLPRRVHQVRFAGAGQETAWCIDLDAHEMGRIEVTDEEFEASLRKEDGNYFQSTDWQDPRKGPLYVLVEKLERREQT